MIQISVKKKHRRSETKVTGGENYVFGCSDSHSKGMKNQYKLHRLKKISFEACYRLRSLDKDMRA